jgi:hypothetical protein
MTKKKTANKLPLLTKRLVVSETPDWKKAYHAEAHAEAIGVGAWIRRTLRANTPRGREEARVRAEGRERP